MTDVLEVLGEARAILLDPDRWTKGSAARNADGLPVASDSFYACSWCMAGAVWTFTSLNTSLANRAIALLAGAVGTTIVGMFGWNDAPERTHAEVLAAYDRAIVFAAVVPGEWPV